MFIDVKPDIRADARLPHNIFMLNLALFHLLMTPASIALNIGVWGMLLPLVLSLSVMAYIFIRSRNQADHSHQFAFLHWQLAIRRCRLLLISYAVTAACLAIGWLVSLSSPDPNMQEILRTVFIRISIMPVLIMVMITFYLESSAINLATRGEIPDSMVDLDTKKI